MNPRPDDERDPELERAWRAQSRETPPPALDRAILAAAHRAVGSGPAAVAPTNAARRPQRWWMPLAAAAAIGVVAIGVLQVAPRDDSLVVPNERVVSDAAPPAPAAAKPEVASGIGTAGTMRESSAASADSTRMTSESARAAEARPAPASAPPPARETEQARAAGAAPPAPAAAPAPEPQAFPRKTDAAPAADRLQGPRMEAASSSDKAGDSAADTRAKSAKATTAAGSVTLANTPAPGAAGAGPAMRDAPAPAAKREAAPEPFPAAPRANVAATADAGAPAPAPAERRADAASGAPAPATSGALEQGLRSVERKDAVMQRQGFAPAPPQAALAAARPQAADAAPPLAKTLADAKAKARDPDAWLARIRKLRADGNTADAVRELREFRDNVPDADRLIPADLRDLANLGPR